MYGRFGGKADVLKQKLRPYVAWEIFEKLAVIRRNIRSTIHLPPKMAVLGGPPVPDPPKPGKTCEISIPQNDPIRPVWDRSSVGAFGGPGEPHG